VANPEPSSLAGVVVAAGSQPPIMSYGGGRAPGEDEILVASPLVAPGVAPPQQLGGRGARGGGSSPLTEMASHASLSKAAPTLAFGQR